jgi:hypothetical protein
MRDSIERIILEENKGLKKLIFFFKGEPKGYELEYYILKSKEMFIEEYLKAEFNEKFINIGNVSFMEYNKKIDAF